MAHRGKPEMHEVLQSLQNRDTQSVKVVQMNVSLRLSFLHAQRQFLGKPDIKMPVDSCECVAPR